MNEFANTCCSGSRPLDAFKRVRYSTGLVLGLDEFLQEETYLLGKDRRHNRGLHGYGTVCGLRVTMEDAAEPTVRVTAGLAVDLHGREVRVPQDECAVVNDWLARNDREVAAHLGSPADIGSPPELSLYVILCYRECETDRVPIPSGPCQSLDQTSTPSRVADNFELSLRLTPPAQVEEDAIRALGALLRAIEISDEPGAFLTQEDLEGLVRNLALPTSPPFQASTAGSPPESILRVHPDDAPDFLRAAVRVWVTDVRPHLLPEGRNCASGPPVEECILLARLAVPIEEIGGFFRIAGAIGIDETDRPYLMQSRLLQEGLWWRHEGGVEVHAALDGLDADDHPQYLLVNPLGRALVTDLDGDGNRIVNLAPGAVPGDAVPFEQAIKDGDPAGGDLAGTYPDPVVAGLQQRPVAAVAPAAADVLTWDGNAWTPRPVPVFETGLTRVTGLSWRHGSLAPLQVSLGDGRVSGIAIAFDANVQVRPGSLDDNTFRLLVELPDAETSFIEIRRVAPSEILPVDVSVDANGMITGTNRVNQALASGAVLLLRGQTTEELFSIRPRPRMLVELRCDFVLDATGRAVDGEFLRGRLPSGDRPAGSVFGIQGGRFDSWFRLRPDRDPTPNDRIDLNLAGFEDLDRLPGIGPVLANRILQFRNERGRFQSVDVLRTIPGMTDPVFEQLRDLVEVG